MIFQGAENREYEMIPVGEYNAVCSGVEDLGLQSFQGGEPNHQCAILFEIDYRVKEGDFAGKRFVMGLTMAPIISKNSKLKKLIESWFDTIIKDPKNFNLDSNTLIGRCATVYISIEPNSKGEKRNKILSVTPPKAKISMEQVGYVPKWILDKKAQAVKFEGQIIPDIGYIPSDDPNAAFEAAAKVDNPDLATQAGMSFDELRKDDLPY